MAPPQPNPRPGAFVTHRPESRIFAISTGSWSGEPAIKTHPCCVVEVTALGIMIAPFCGAIKNKGQWVRRHNMDFEAWQPVQFQNVQRPVVVPPDGAPLQRGAFPVKHDPAIAPPDSFQGLKPCYIWVRDSEEQIKYSKVKKLERNNCIWVTSAQIANLKQWWQFFQQQHQTTV
ncbi:hypothetical protein BS17DRAFT_788952 [Gyrodon lividus]|nr:hypothetical protein BS17DRAFT_788952 [Gyrodon lividus]